MPAHTTALAGQDTLLACWRALSDTAFGPLTDGLATVAH